MGIDEKAGRQREAGEIWTWGVVSKIVFIGRIMIPKDELDKVISIAEKYSIRELYLIGSALYKKPKRGQ